MTERIAQTDPAPPPSPEELLTKDLDEITLILRTWYRQRDNDSVEVQDMRAREYAYGCGKLEKTIDSADHDDFEVGLTTGEEEISTVSFAKGAYDMLREHRGRPISPGSFFRLITTKKTISGYNPHGVHRLYVGTYSSKLEVATIAELLAEDKATLGLRKKEEDEPINPLEASEPAR